jgi:hypothetical protein
MQFFKLVPFNDFTSFHMHFASFRVFVFLCVSLGVTGRSEVPSSRRCRAREAALNRLVACAHSVATGPWRTFVACSFLKVFPVGDKLRPKHSEASRQQFWMLCIRFASIFFFRESPRHIAHYQTRARGRGVS